LHWGFGTDRDAWIEELHQALDAVEKLRDLQPEGQVRAGVFQLWAYPYYRFSGYLLQGLSSSPDPEGDLQLAFRIIERMRSRVLIDELDRTAAHPRQDSENPEALRRMEILENVARIQRQLADPSLSESTRAEHLAELERLEREEVVLRDAIARSDLAFARLRTPVIPELEQLQKQLAHDQAILSFQLSTRETGTIRTINQGGSWVIALTRDGIEAFPLVEEDIIKEKVRLYLGLCGRRDGAEYRLAGKLYDDLLAEPLRHLGPSVERLVIVPDGCLHHLPFAALRPDRDANPVGVTYEITQVPSVTLWARWKSEQREGQASSVLALADPELGGSEEDGTVRAADPWMEGLQLGALPYARREARKVIRYLGGGTLLSGPEANESDLKQTDLEEFGIVHFAAHAVVDYDRPERSAVLLTPGAIEEDGFLQPREIVDLDLDGKVVILSSCRSAAGTVQRGEGVLGLGRAFFQAGAHAVVGSLWPMRDEDAEQFMAEFAERLGEGETLSAAFRAARTARIRAGDPVDAWAGMILIGNGDFVPAGNDRSMAVSPVRLGIGIACVVLLAGLVLFFRIRRR
jgi:CHAT domain-containing protein